MPKSKGMKNMDLWQLPDSVNLGGKNFCFDPDYRNILEIFRWFQNPNLTDFFKWEICLALFYKETVPEDLVPQAISYFLDFVNMGAPSRPGPRLIDWEQDAGLILSDINGLLGRDIRKEKHIHWWTFLSWFHSITSGQLLSVVQVRRKLSLHQPLTEAEKAFYRQAKDKIDLKARYTPEEQAQRAALNALLDGKRQVNHG